MRQKKINCTNVYSFHFYWNCLLNFIYFQSKKSNATVEEWHDPIRNLISSNIDAFAKPKN